MVSLHDPMWPSHALHSQNTNLRSTSPNRCNAAHGTCPDGAVFTTVFIGQRSRIPSTTTVGTSLRKHHARRSEWRLHYVSHLVQVVCQQRPSTTTVFTVFWWYYVHTQFETYRRRYVSNVQCGQVIQASFQKIQVTEHPSKLMQCCPPGMSSGCRLYCRLNMEGLPDSIPNYRIFVIQEQPV